MNIEIADVMLSTVTDGDVRVNIGDRVDGKGYAASIGYWGVDGFPSRPNPTSSAGAAQAVYLTQGNQRRVIASRDNRFVGPFGDLGEGDRAIVSDCAAGLHLDKSANAIRLQAGAGVEVVVDGAAGTVTVSKGTASVVLSTVATVDTITLTAGASSIVITSTSIAMSAAAVTVNNIPIP